MAGHLRVNPLVKSFDELQRTEKRMENYLDMFHLTLSDDEKESIQILLEGVKKALKQIPEEFRVTRHFQKKQ
jgi:uncharacterized protein YsxB (DUF464 family)